jgi:hypothetical protein
MLQGNFTFVSLQSAWEVQQHIHHHGAVLTRYDIDNHFRQFYEQPNNIKATYQASQVASNQSVEGHAVLLVGYDLQKSLWYVGSS